MLKKKPVTGMRDMSPEEMEIRDYVLKTIREVYTGYGFTQIETPVCEHLQNLTSKQGGDNEKLIFKILKRGNKLHLDTATCEEDVSDMGLRYDLTVPLCRYYSAHKEELPAPFKALQTGPVWRADRPQKGRFRQFVQYDIDILGEPSVLAEIELILAMTDVLDRLTFKLPRLPRRDALLGRGVLPPGARLHQVQRPRGERPCRSRRRTVIQLRLRRQDRRGRIQRRLLRG